MTYDTPTTLSTLKNVAASVAALQPYLNAVRDLPLGVVSLTPPPGLASIPWPPLTSLPTMATALQLLQQHSADFRSNALVPLANFPAQYSAFVGDGTTEGILADLVYVQSVLGQTAPPSAEQQQKTINALKDMVQRVGSVNQLLAGIHNASTTFLTQTAADITTLQSAALTITNYYQSDASSKDLIQYLLTYLGPAGFDSYFSSSTPTPMIIQAAGALTSIVTALQNVIALEPTSLTSLEDLQNIFTQLQSSCQTTVAEVQAATDAQFDSFLQQLDVTDAQSFWQDTAAFLKTYGLVPA